MRPIAATLPKPPRPSDSAAASALVLRAPGGEALGLATFNPHSLIAARLLTSNPEATVDALFLGRRLAQAAALRDRLIGVPYYRLIHAEADGLPGVIVDRFGDALVVQLNSAGMDRLAPVLFEALEAELSPATIVLKNDSPVRELEGLKREVTVAKGNGVDTVVPGTPTTYTITVTNTGPNGSPAVRITDPVPADHTSAWTCSVTGGLAGTGPAGTPLTVRSLPCTASIVSGNCCGVLTAKPCTQAW